MGRKAREGSVNLYYLKNQNDSKDKSVSKRKSNGNKNVKAKKKANKQVQKPKQDKFNFDDEIVIGVTKISDDKKKIESKNKQKKVVNKKSTSSKTKKVQAKQKNKKSKENRLKNLKIFKYIFIICALLAATIFIMLSPIFNITEIKVQGNNIISSEEIISLSGIKVGENIYKINKNKVSNDVKQNAYIESVLIKRKIPTILEINVNERQATYMLEYVGSYAYVNNQGYMLDISDTKIEKPILIGISTESDNIKVGNRLSEEDLVKLEDVLKIMESATSNEIERLITKIDISDASNYILHMETEGKTVMLGDIKDLSTKMLHVKALLEKEEGVHGEIIVDSVSENGKSRFIQKIN